MSTAAQITRQVLDDGLSQLRNGWAASEVVAVLVDAAVIIDAARIFCQHCGEEVEDGTCCSWCADVRGCES